jgi:hypothetical protein
MFIPAYGSPDTEGGLGAAAAAGRGVLLAGTGSAAELMAKDAVAGLAAATETRAAAAVLTTKVCRQQQTHQVV